MRFSRKVIMTTGAGAAAVLLSASAAFACLTALGTITLNSGATLPTGGTVADTVIGAGGAMTFCNSPARAAAVTKGNNVTVAVAPSASSSCAGVKQLPDGTYQVRLQDNTASTSWKYVGSMWTFQSNTGCWKVTSKTLSTTYSVVSGTNSGTSVAIPSTANSSGPNNAAGLCVGDGTNGMFAPIHIN